MIRALALVTVAISLLSVSACAKKPRERVAEPAGQWLSLFNGKDLDDWDVKIAGFDAGVNYADTFRVRNGLLTVSYDGYDRFQGRFGSLFSKTRLSHYWLRAEYRFVGKLTAGAPSWAYENSGIQLHSQAPQTMRRAQQFPVSVEFDIVGDRLLGHHPTGDVCENGTRLKIGGVPLADKCSKVSDVKIAGDQWVTILAEIDGGRRVRQIVNGELVVEYTDVTLDDQDPDARKLIAVTGDKALTSGYISIQSNGHPIEFRRIDVLPIG